MLGYYENGGKNNVLFKQLFKRSPNTLLLNDSVSETAIRAFKRIKLKWLVFAIFTSCV